MIETISMNHTIHLHLVHTAIDNSIPYTYLNISDRSQIELGIPSWE